MLRQSAKETTSWGSLNRQPLAAPGKGPATDFNTRLSLEEELSERLQQYDSTLRERVERAYKSWNLIVRDQLRNETGLRLSGGDEIQSVPVRVVDGLPDHFLDALPDSAAEICLILNRPFINMAAQGLHFVDENFRMISEWQPIQPIGATAVEVGRVRAIVERLDLELSRLDFIKEVFTIPKDALGAYLFELPMVHLYWMAIGIVAANLSLSVEALTVVVLAHELTHAYTHLGRDIDGVRWHTESFADADVNIVEGLAQYYTEVLCCNLDHRIPGLLMAYQKLLERESGPYIVHLQWAARTSHAKEIVRGTLIECRTRRVLDYAEFERILGRLSKHISGKSDV